MKNLNDILPNWQNRYTVKRYHESLDVTDEEISMCREALRNTPLQAGQATTHHWLELKKEDRAIKKFLLKNNYFNTLNGKPYVYMLAVLTAPVVYIACKQKVPYEGDTELKHPYYDDDGPADRNIGVDLGALLVVCNLMGLDTAIQGCHNWNNDSMPEWQMLIKQRFNIDIKEPPGVAFTLGHAIHSFDQEPHDYYTDEDGFEYRFQSVPNTKKSIETPSFRIYE